MTTTNSTNTTSGISPIPPQRLRGPSSGSGGPRRRLAVPVGMAALALLAATACGSDGNDDGASGTPAETVELTAIDYAYTGLPQEVGAGATLTLDNDSDKEVHEVVAIRLPDDEERSVADIVALPPDELAAFFPLVQTVVVAAPEESGVVVEGDGVLREPGRYALICVIPTGADPAEYLAAAAASEGGPPQVDGGPPHIVEGMFAEITVVG